MCASDNVLYCLCLQWSLLCSHCLFGRNWGCAPGKEFKHLHFELCYYQAIEEAIQRKLPRVEAGAQGEHKLQRGLLPNFTYSAHYMPDPMMKAAVQKFLDRENVQVGVTAEARGEGVLHLSAHSTSPCEHKHCFPDLLRRRGAD